jgi:hypothetical protein
MRKDTFRRLHGDSRSAVGNIIREIDEKLCKAAFRSRIVAEYRGEGGVAERFGEALAESFTSPAIVTESDTILAHGDPIGRLLREYRDSEV